MKYELVYTTDFTRMPLYETVKKIWNFSAKFRKRIEISAFLRLAF
jgi:hypothetical protein